MSRLIELSKTSSAETFKLLVGIIGPRPIGWISTISESGVPNLAPFSFFNMFGNNPPIIGFSPAIGRGGQKKDTLINVEKTKCFVQNVVTRELADVMNKTAENFPYGVSEFEKVGLTAVPAKFVSAPLVKEAPINLECKLIQIVSLGEKPGNGQIVLGEVVAVHINDESVVDHRGMIDSRKLRLISRLGKLDYSDLGEIFSMPRTY